MSEAKSQEVGTVGWIDLTVDDATGVRDFYRDVVGWKTSDVPMGDYSDYCMNTPDTGTTVAGVCHRQGGNAGMPARWMIYITVADLDAAISRCRESGGEVLGDPRTLEGQGRFAVIRDPAGAECALWEYAS